MIAKSETCDYYRNLFQWKQDPLLGLFLPKPTADLYSVLEGPASLLEHSLISITFPNGRKQAAY